MGGSADHPLIDADQHYYESDDCFSRHIDPAFRDRAIRPVPSNEPGLGTWVAGDRVLRSFSAHNLADFSPAPGAFEDFFSGKIAINEGGETCVPRSMPALMQREPRYALMDDQHIRAAIVLPSMGVEVEHEFIDDIPALCSNYRGFNRWLEDEWGYGADGRIFSTPMVTMLDLDFAVEETERLAERGSRFIFLKTGPVGGRSPADPYFDRFWSAVQAAEMTVIYHLDLTEYNEMFAKHWSEDPDRYVYQYSPLQHYYTILEKPISDTIAALTLHNLFGRFPGVQIATIELGSEWVRPLFRLLDKATKMGAQGEFLGGRLSELPSDILRQHLHCSPYYEDDLDDLAELLGCDRILFGSDYPHPEGLKEPASILGRLSHLPPDRLRLVTHDNAARLLGLSTLVDA